ncbi:hypothetical protein AeNC1_013468 [Aphanomyces euteiches]|nr:hypothetical protein AeNC1_013468 [Aphanomyces euteiches]
MLSLDHLGPAPKLTLALFITAMLPATTAIVAFTHGLSTSRLCDLSTCGEETESKLLEVEVPQHIAIKHVEEVSYSTVKMNDDLVKRFERGYAKSDEYSNNSKFVKKGNLYFVKSKDQVWRLCVPDDDELKCEIISQSHDTSTTAHPGARRTQLHFAQWYCWRGLEDDVKLYVATRETCARYKSRRAKDNGHMIPIKSPDECWHTVSVDWITGLPVSSGYHH